MCRFMAILTEDLQIVHRFPAQVFVCQMMHFKQILRVANIATPPVCLKRLLPFLGPFWRFQIGHVIYGAVSLEPRCRFLGFALPSAFVL